MTTIVAISGAAGNHARNQRVPAAMAARNVVIGAIIDPRLDGEPSLPGANQVADWIADPASTGIARGWGYRVPDTRRDRPAVFANMRDIPDSLGVELVIDSGPSPTHFETARYCLDRGWAVNSEKPGTMDRAQAHRLAALPRAAGRPVVIGYPGVWQLAAARAELGLNPIGAVISGKAEWHRKEMYWLPPHFYNRRGSGVGPDLLGHVVIPLDALMDARPVEVLWATARRERGIATFGADFLGYDTIEAELRFENGASVVVWVTWGDGEEREGFKQDNNEGLRFQFMGTRGSATYHGIVPQGHAYPDAREFRGEIVSDTGPRPGAIPRNYQDAIVLQTEEVAAAAVAEDPEPFVQRLMRDIDGELAVHAINQAAETGGPVPIQQF